MIDTSKPKLLVLPSLAIYRNVEGRLFLTQKYLDGVSEFAKSWPGQVTSLLSIRDAPSSEMDMTEIDLEAGSSGLEVRPTDKVAFERRLQSAAVVTGHLSPRELETAKFCHDRRIPLFFTSEYTPKTEGQIVDADTRNPLLRLRRKLWIRSAEKARRHILRSYTTGLQCSGTPTFDLYKQLTSNALLFFDNRVRANHIISNADLAAKCARLVKGHPLRLVFGGRLVKMKGVLELPRVARELIKSKVPFTFDIVGDGLLEAQLRRKIADLGDDRIRLRPAMDFRAGWIPFLQQQADLFICCHPQGDPSSTYPEVMSCGVPIVGYDNEAWAGVLRSSGAGWRSPIGDSAGLARHVAELHDARNRLVDAAWQGHDFAAKHCFENTFVRRTSHLAEALSAT